MGGARDKASPRVITILHVRGFLPVWRACVRARERARAREREAVDRALCALALVWERERGVNMDHASSRARSTLSRRLSPSACAARLSVLIRRPLFVAVSLRRPGQRTPTCAYLRGLVRGLLRIWIYVRTSSRWEIPRRRLSRGFFGLLSPYALHIITVIGVCSWLSLNINISSFSNPIKTIASELITRTRLQDMWSRCNRCF